MKTRFSIFLLLVLSLKVANAATYYVDASFGNDNWSGNQSSPIGSPATDGPWQSLAKVSAKVLAPGDSVLLKCGGLWYETLTLQSSGTAANPITIGAYPSACANKPIINGSTLIPAHNWVRDTGNIYKLTSAIDVITFGSFENGLGNWTKWSPQNNATMNLITSCAQAGSTCMSFTAGSGTSLVTSNYFALQGKQSYTASFTLKAPQGTTVQVLLRRAVVPRDAAGLTSSIVGTGNWQTLAFPFTATASLSSARLDFVVPANLNIVLDDVKITATLANVLGVFDNGKTVNVAHHPNRGYDPLKPDSLYFSAAENANSVSLTNGGVGSSYVTTGTDFSTLAHPAITPGTGIRIRPNAWTLDDRKITSVSGSRLTFDSPTTYPVQKDWGYFLYGQRWMLDEPGESHYDAAAKAVYVWMADSLAPGNRISLGQRSTGIEASNRSHIRIDGLTIQNMATGVRMQKATNVVLNNMNILDTLGLGVDAMGSIDSGIEGSQIARTTGSAIYAGDFAGSRFHAYNNLISDIGVSTTNGIITSLPVGAQHAAILAGDSGDIRENRIYGTSYVGILPLANSLISGNHIENTCMVFDDCSAIYTFGQNNNSTIENNTVLHVVGGLPGKPAIIPTQSQGIYLDELSSGVTVRGNTVVDADNGIQIHNAANNQIENNTFYGNRNHHIWLQEGSKLLSPEGDIYGNQVLGNRLFLTSSTPAIRQTTLLPKTDTTRFADFDGNRYFTFLWPNISTESWPTGSLHYTLPKWQAATTSANIPRNLDPSGTQVNSASLGYAAFRTLGGNIVPNGNFSAGTEGWGSWNATAPAGQMILASCALVGPCLTYAAGGSVGLVKSPNFSVIQDQWYKASFDLKTGTNGQTVGVITRRGGGGSNGYEQLMDTTFIATGSTSWQRYSFVFKATKSVNAGDLVTGDLGARIDFNGISPGQNISVTNLEMVPLSSVDATVSSHILVNPTGAMLDHDCPDGNGAPTCNQYVSFTDNQSVSWPYAVQPHGSEIVYTRDSTLGDGDGDGIPDSQDSCSGTLALKAVNGAGCALGQ
ncbi:MAG: right-handed parallel beta-helix repeat-containing protein [Thiobacillus sp.]|nr:right-handed parallel beta-helix repeat-containing protein [Thiobacillus sp.]